MHVHIDRLGIDLKKKDSKREVMLHHAVAVAVLYGLCEQRTLDIAPVHAVVFEGAASPGYLRSADKTPHRKPLLRPRDRKQFTRYLSAVELIDDVLYFSIPARVKAALPVRKKADGDFRVRQRQLFRECRDMRGLRDRRL